MYCRFCFVHVECIWCVWTHFVDRTLCSPPKYSSIQPRTSFTVITHRSFNHLPNFKTWECRCWFYLCHCSSQNASVAMSNLIMLPWGSTPVDNGTLCSLWWCACNCTSPCMFLLLLLENDRVFQGPTLSCSFQTSRQCPCRLFCYISFPAFLAYV